MMNHIQIDKECVKLGQNEKFNRSAAVRCLEILGLADSENVEFIKDGRYRHIARNGTIRELDVMSAKEYFSRRGRYPGEKLHRVMTKYVVEVIVERNGRQVAPRFYTIDPQYSKYNNQRFKLIRSGNDGECCQIELDCGDVIIAFVDETNGFIREHEKDPIELPVSWEVSGCVNNQKSTIAEALSEFYDRKNELEPDVGDYVYGSMDLTVEDECDIAESNHAFRNPNRVRHIDTEKVSA